MSDNALNTLCNRLREQGWFPWVHATSDGYHCELRCSIAKLKAEIPRPIGRGDTVLEAVQNAVLNANELMVGRVYM